MKLPKQRWWMSGGTTWRRAYSGGIKFTRRRRVMEAWGDYITERSTDG